MKKICLFCGSSSGKNEAYTKGAFAFGEDLAKREIGLVYGGASIGVMGAAAEGALQNKGKVWGVIPQSIVDLEVGHQGLTELIIVGSMHERKQKMYDLSDAFVALPGGMGTLDEFCEIVTWAQLKYHEKPVYIVNQNGFFDGLLQHFRHMNQEGFFSDDHMRLFKEVDSTEEALKHFLS